VHEEFMRGELNVRVIERPALVSTVAVATLRERRAHKLPNELRRTVIAEVNKLVADGVWRRFATEECGRRQKKRPSPPREGGCWNQPGAMTGEGSPHALSPCHVATPHPSEHEVSALHALSRRGRGRIYAHRGVTESSTSPPL